MTAASAIDCRQRPGRMCPLDYQTDPADLARPAEFSCGTLYVVGGLYGNSFALDAIEGLAAAEPGPVTIVFNGDAHWFDAESGAFERLDARLARYSAIKGNIEFELARSGDIGAGCGCAYPAEVDDGVVERSNGILRRLRSVLAATSPIRRRLGALPLNLVAQVGNMRIGVVHGDAMSVAGWGFARDRLDDPASAPRLDAIRNASRIDVFASTHTCGAVMRDFALPSGRFIVANSGAAGMGNFDGDTRGLITRISARPSPHATLYGLRLVSAHVDALPIAFDCDAFVREFDAIWPAGSDAALSYRQRILGRVDGEALRFARPLRQQIALPAQRNSAGKPARHNHQADTDRIPERHEQR